MCWSTTTRLPPTTAEALKSCLVEDSIADDCPQEYTLLRTFTATDDAGNATALTQTITVVDTTAPELFVPPSYEADCGDELILLDGIGQRPLRRSCSDWRRATITRVPPATC